jgi:hypothetical protein
MKFRSRISRFEINIFIIRRHPIVIILDANFLKKKISDIPHLFEMLSPYINSHLFAGEDGSHTDVI